MPVDPGLGSSQPCSKVCVWKAYKSGGNKHKQPFNQLKPQTNNPCPHGNIWQQAPFSPSRALIKVTNVALERGNQPIHGTLPTSQRCLFSKISFYLLLLRTSWPVNTQHHPMGRFLIDGNCSGILAPMPSSDSIGHTNTKFYISTQGEV